MKERHVLSSCIKQRMAYDLLAPHVERDDFSEQGWVVWTGIADYYDRDAQAERVDGSILSDDIARHIAIDKHKDMFRNLVSGLVDFESSPENVVVDYLSTKRDALGHKLAAALLGAEDVGSILDQYNDIYAATDLYSDDETEDARVGFSVEELVSVGFNADNLIEVYPKALNSRLDGGVKPGHHLILFARPEMGKTMFTIEMMAGFARQGLKVLYIGNEDPIDDINMRVVNRLAGMTKLEVMNDPKMADARAREAGYENIVLKGLAPGTPREIDQLINKHTPDVLVLDQLRNLNMHQDNYVLKLEQAATQARTWAKKYSCVVVSVTQAGDSASGKAVLDLGDVDYSNTGIPAQADVMIGLGANDNHAKNGEIVISLPKNKVSGNHEYFTCGVEPHLSQVVSLG